jgi:hypothetical protein
VLDASRQVRRLAASLLPAFLVCTSVAAVGAEDGQTTYALAFEKYSQNMRKLAVESFMTSRLELPAAALRRVGSLNVGIGVSSGGGGSQCHVVGNFAYSVQTGPSTWELWICEAGLQVLTDATTASLLLWMDAAREASFATENGSLNLVDIGGRGRSADKKIEKALGYYAKTHVDQAAHAIASRYTGGSACLGDEVAFAITRGDDLTVCSRIAQHVNTKRVQASLEWANLLVATTGFQVAQESNSIWMDLPKVSTAFHTFRDLVLEMLIGFVVRHELAHLSIEDAFLASPMDASSRIAAEVRADQFALAGTRGAQTEGMTSIAAAMAWFWNTIDKTEGQNVGAGGIKERFQSLKTALCQRAQSRAEQLPIDLRDRDSSVDRRVLQQC